MGSTGIHLERGRKMADAALADLDPRLTVLKHVTRRTSGEWQYALYAAVEDRVEEKVFALVVLMHRNPSPSVYWNFAYKYVDETMGPYEDECPREVFDLLTPTDNEYANEWRRRVQANLDQPTPPRLRPGVVVTFDRPLTFSDQFEGNHFTHVKRDHFRRTDNAIVRIPNWRARGGKVAG